MRPRSPPAWAGRREGSFHGHEGEVVTLTRGCISPSPQPSPVKGEGESPHLNLPPKWGKKGITLPVRPSGFRPRIEYGAGSARERRWGFLASRAARGEGGFQTRPYGSRATRCRAATGESPSPRPSPVKGEEVRAPFHARYSVVLSGWRHQGGERPGCVESMGTP